MSEPDPIPDLPEGSKVFDHIFPGYAFTPSGEVYLIRSDEFLLPPQLVPAHQVAKPGSLNSDQGTSYQMRSKSGQIHSFTRASIKALFLRRREDTP